MKLQIADNLAFPLDAVTQTFAAIGRKGAGKTYLSSMLAEQMLDAGAQVVVLDAVGNWWGLRVAADGKAKGKDIFVVGGEHGDIPLVPEAGAKVARLLVEKRISVVLDISGFRIGERKRFATDFAEEFFHLKKTQRSPVHVFIEEAQLFVPQKFMGDEARMYGAFEAIVRIGRNYGIGCTLITQRPQSVNKEVLSQVECLCVLQVNGTHERKALEEWVQEAGADRKLVGELPGMMQGEGFVWSPSWLRIFKRVRFAKKVTFDASATPEVGKATKAARLSEVDVESLRESMSEVIAQAEKDDPKVLRRQIADLKKQLDKQTVAVNAWQEPIEKIVEVQVLDSMLVKDFRDCASILGGTINSLQSEIRKIEKRFEDIVRLCQEKKEHQETRRAYPVLPKPVIGRQPIIHNIGANSNGDLAKGERIVLRAVAQYTPDGGIEGDSLSVLVGYKRSSRDAYVSRLQAKGYVERRGDKIVATDGGISALGRDFEPLPVGRELRDYWIGKLPAGERKILEIMLRHGQRDISKEDIDRDGVYKRSSRDAYLLRLAARKLIKSVGSGVVRVSEKLFD